jgi:hypothetical protein
VFQQHGEDLEGLFLKFDLPSLLLKLARSKINLEGSEANQA